MTTKVRIEKKTWQAVEKELPSVKNALEKALPPLDQLEQEINT